MMPTYLVTDILTKAQTMVEAQRPAAALSALIANRFSVSDALTVPEALRYMARGADFIDTNGATLTDPSFDEPVSVAAEEPVVIAFDEEGELASDPDTITRGFLGLAPRPAEPDDDEAIVEDDDHALE